jgi:hypothetical protein
LTPGGVGITTEPEVVGLKALAEDSGRIIAISSNPSMDRKTSAVGIGRIVEADDMNRHPTTSRSSDLLEGVFLGYGYSPEIRNHLNCRRFLCDFESGPGAN